MPKPATAFLFLMSACVGATILLHAQSNAVPDRVERPFVSGGAVFLKLSAGAYRIEGAPEQSIRARWRTRDSRDMGRVRSRLDVKGRNATLVLDGPANNFEADISLPQRTNMVLRLSAGDLQVRGIDGNKDIDLWAGDVTIQVGEAQRYRRVDASVRAGQITAQPFNLTKGGLFRSIEYAGNGPYELRVKLFAGDLKLVH